MELIDLFLLLLFLIYLFVRCCHNWRPDPWPSTGMKLPQNQVHRGYWIEGNQENTLEAFREAHRRGQRMVELDVQLSKDKIPIVFHDKELTRLARRTEKVSELTAKELKELAKIPTLEDVLIDKEGPIYFNVEIKESEILNQFLAKAVAKIIIKTNSQSKIIFSSFNPVTLRALWKLLPQVPRALLATNDSSDPEVKIYLRKLWLGGFAHAHMVNLDKKMITSSLMKRLEERKIPVAAWTVNDKDTADLLLNKGVISIISDQIFDS